MRAQQIITFNPDWEKRKKAGLCPVCGKSPEEFDKVMSEPIKGCRCGFIKEGDETYCPKCEVLEE